MNQAVAKAQIEAHLRSRFGQIFTVVEKPPANVLSSGIPEIDALTGGGLPRGAISEIVGAASSGRASLLLAALAQATTNGETCVIVDVSDSFDPASANNAGVDLNRLLWIRCGTSVERAFKATDLLLQSGGFGFVTLNLAGLAGNYARRIISSWWFRFRRAIENTPTALAVITPIACVRSCASIILEVKYDRAMWPTAGRVLQTNTGEYTDLTTPHRLSLVQNSPLDEEPPFSSLSHAHLLRTINVRVRLAKPAIWTESTVRFRQRLRGDLT